MGTHTWEGHTLPERFAIVSCFLLAIAGWTTLLQLAGFILSANINLSPVITGVGTGILAAGVTVLAIDRSPHIRTTFATVAFLSSQFVLFDATNTMVHLLCWIGLSLVGGSIVYARVWRTSYPLDRFFFNVGSVFLLVAGTALVLRMEFDPSVVFEIHHWLLALLVITGAILWTTGLALWTDGPPQSGV